VADLAGIGHVHLIVADHERAARFYSQHVGLSLAPGQNLDAAVEDVVRAGGQVVQRGEHAPGLPFAYVTDPDGNMLEL
jgi:predicted enzyme related to lactoylglutathione lyase